jgi:hypothetical protein
VGAETETVVVVVESWTRGPINGLFTEWFVAHEYIFFGIVKDKVSLMVGKTSYTTHESILLRLFWVV